MIKFCFPSLKIKPFYEFNDLAANVLVGDFHMILIPASSIQLDQYKDLVAVSNVKLTRTQCLDFFEMETIAAKYYHGSIEMFTYFQIFSPKIWITTIFFLILIAILSSIKIDQDYSLKLLVKNFSNLTILLMSVSINKLSPQLLYGFWFIFVVFFIQYFSAYLLDFMVRSIPLVTINTLEDLSLRTDMQIITRDHETLVKHIEENDTPLKRAIFPRFKTFLSYDEDNVQDKLELGLINGTLAFIHEYLILVFRLIDLIKTKNVSLDSIHISRESTNFQPYFLLINGDMPPWLFTSLNKMYKFIIIYSDSFFIHFILTESPCAKSQGFIISGKRRPWILKRINSQISGSMKNH